MNEKDYFLQESNKTKPSSIDISLEQIQNVFE